MSTAIQASQLVDQETWIKQTSTTFLGKTESRSEELKEIDKCYNSHYKAYNKAIWKEGYGYSSDRSYILSGISLLEALETYLRKKAKGSWKNSKRDKKTGGQFEALHDYAKIFSPYAHSTNLLLKDAIEKREIPHTRMGVLYLLAHIEVPPFQVTPSLVTGAIKELATVAVSAASTQYTPKGSKVGSDGNMEDFGFRVSDDGTFDTEIKVLDLEKMQICVDPVEYGLERLDSIGKKTDNLVAPKVRDPNVPKVSKTRRLLNSIASYFMKLWKSIHETWTDINQPGGLRFYMIQHRSEMEQHATSLIKMILQRLFSKAIPYLDGAMDTAQGFAKTAYYIALKIKNNLNKKHFSITPGHPELTAQALEDEISGARNGGIKDAIKGAISIVMSFFAPGLSGLVSSVITAAEWFFEKISLYREQIALREIIKTARTHYADAKSLEPGLMAADDKGNLKNNGSNAIVNDEAKFTEFMRSAVEASSTLAVLTLNSGICGNFMTWIQILDQKNHMVTAQAVQHANEYFTRLKRFGAKLLRDSEIEILPLDATPPADVPAPQLGQEQIRSRYIAGILRHAKEGHEGRATVAKFIGGVVMGESIA